MCGGFGFGDIGDCFVLVVDCWVFFDEFVEMVGYIIVIMVGGVWNNVDCFLC